MNNGSWKYKNMDTMNNVMLTYIKLIDVPLFLLYVVICIETPSIVVVDPEE
jgi:hypothetical protein